MKCVYCGGKVEPRQVTFAYDEEGDYFFIENVPAEVCTQCGEKTYSPQVTDELIRLAKRRLKPARKVQVPVFDFAVQV
jgi:HTH-type transcriptional regulator / antitoxin MqsA